MRGKLRWKVVMRRGNWVYIGVTPTLRCEVGRITHVHPGDWELEMVGHGVVELLSDLKEAKALVQATWLMEGGNDVP